MAVDIGALIAESIDDYYAHQSWNDRYRSKVRSIIKHVRAGTFQEALLNEQDGGQAHADKNLRDDPTYRKGYKSGWKDKKDGGDGNPNPKDPADAQNENYVNGFQHGYGASGHARTLLQLHGANKHDQAADYAFRNINMPHAEDYSDHGGRGKGSRPHNDFDDAMIRWDEVNRNPKTDVRLHHRSVTDTVSAINAIDRSVDAHPGDDVDPAVFHRDNWKHKEFEKRGGRVGNRPDAPLRPAQIHPADFVHAMNDKLTTRSYLEQKEKQRHAGLYGGQSLEPAADGRGDDYGGNSGMIGAGGDDDWGDDEIDVDATVGAVHAADPGVDSTSVDAQQHSRRQAQHEEHLRNLKSAAFGHIAFTNHEAGTHPNPAIDAFHQAHYDADHGGRTATDRAGAFHTATVSAHEAWKANIINHLREIQSGRVVPPHSDAFTSNQFISALKKNSVPISRPIPGDPYGRHGLVLNDGSLTSHDFKYKFKEHRGQFQQTVVDPIEVLGHALNDPRGFASSGREGDDPEEPTGWVVKAMQKNPAFAGFTTLRVKAHLIAKIHGLYEQATQENPKNPVESAKGYKKRITKVAHTLAEAHPQGGQAIGGQIRPHGGSFDAKLRRLRIALHLVQNAHGERLATNGNHEEDGEEAPMWRHHHAIADFNRKTAKGEEPSPEEHQKIYTKTRPKHWSKFQLKNQMEYIRTAQLTEAIRFMVDTFQDWIREHVNIDEVHFPAIVEELYSKIQPTYGHLFEVEND